MVNISRRERVPTGADRMPPVIRNDSASTYRHVSVDSWCDVLLQAILLCRRGNCADAGVAK